MLGTLKDLKELRGTEGNRCSFAFMVKMDEQILDFVTPFEVLVMDMFGSMKNAKKLFNAVSFDLRAIRGRIWPV